MGSVCVYTWAFLIYGSDLLWYVGTITLGCAPTLTRVLRYLHEARCCLSKGQKKKPSMTQSQEFCLYPKQKL